MKKVLVKFVRKILYLIIKILRFPKLKISINRLNIIKKGYIKKEIDIVHHNFKLDNNINLTIIIPVYNTEHYIRHCIDSIVGQKTKYKYNIVIINDGSTDNSLDILKDYEKKYENIKVITQENQGISKTRNVGIRNISGEYVAFIDSDDYIEDGYIERLLDSAYLNNADIVRCNYYEYDVNEKRIIKTGKNQSDKVYFDGLKSEILSYKGFPWGGVFKSSLWENIEYPNDYWYEDMIIRMILFRKAKVFAYINDKLYYYCWHKNNISNSIGNTKNIKCLDQFFLVEELYKFSHKLNIEDDEALFISILNEYSVVLWLRTRGIEENLRKEIFFRACEIIESMELETKLSKYGRLEYNIFKRKDYIIWKVYAIYRLLGIKYGVE